MMSVHTPPKKKPQNLIEFHHLSVGFFKNIVIAHTALRGAFFIRKFFTAHTNTTVWHLNYVKIYAV